MMNMKALAESERCQYKWSDGVGTRCSTVVEYRILVHVPLPKAFDLCGHHTTMTEDTLAMLGLSHGRIYIGIGSTRREVGETSVEDDPRFNDLANDGALDAQMESQP